MVKKWMSRTGGLSDGGLGGEGVWCWVGRGGCSPAGWRLEAGVIWAASRGELLCQLSNSLYQFIPMPLLYGIFLTFSANAKKLDEEETALTYKLKNKEA